MGQLYHRRNMSGMSDEGCAFSGTATYETEFNVKSMPEACLNWVLELYVIFPGCSLMDMR